MTMIRLCCGHFTSVTNPCRSGTSIFSRLPIRRYQPLKYSLAKQRQRHEIGLGNKTTSKVEKWGATYYLLWHLLSWVYFLCFAGPTKPLSLVMNYPHTDCFRGRYTKCWMVNQRLPGEVKTRWVQASYSTHRGPRGKSHGMWPLTGNTIVTPSKNKTSLQCLQKYTFPVWEYQNLFNSDGLFLFLSPDPR